ncbi:MAG: ferrous iron transport protein B [Saprospiraceae bacterium]
MSNTNRIKIGLAGNPNSGKSSLFNYLTSLNQQVSNFPGVTVDKKSGEYLFGDSKVAEIIDLPGTYSTFPNSTEEKIVINILTNRENKDFPDFIVYVADVTQLEKHLLFASQIKDLGISMIFVLNMVDLLDTGPESMDTIPLRDYLQCPIIPISLRNNINLDLLKEILNTYILKFEPKPTKNTAFVPSDKVRDVVYDVYQTLQTPSLYHAKLVAHHYKWLDYVSESDKLQVEKIVSTHHFEDIRSQVEEVMVRYNENARIASKVLQISKKNQISLTDTIDKWVTHRFVGPIIFFLIMIFVFQAIFSWATYPMDKIEEGFALASEFVGKILPESWFSGMVIHGLLPGLAGVLVFIPQIAILFLLISILEESGYMSRVVYMFDGILQKFGMNGRSMVSLISSGACAIPAIMAARTISNTKERLITILVSPLISCSARLPVYAVLIGFVVPPEAVFGFLNLQGLVFMGLYLLGIIAALIAGLAFKYLIKSETSSFLMIELPHYKPPVWRNIVVNVKEKVLSFITGAGQIIIVISMMLYFLASFGPGDNFRTAEREASIISDSLGLAQEEKENLLASMKLEASYIGIAGKSMEALISPLGFDWKIGVALITSFAAREVFVGTMSTIYSLGSDSDEKTIRQKMADEIRPETGQKLYDRKTSLALIVFYVFALQCMSTLAVTKKETNTWKWPIIQFLFMGLLAYVGAFITYRIF